MKQRQIVILGQTLAPGATLGEHLDDTLGPASNFSATFGSLLSPLCHHRPPQGPAVPYWPTAGATCRFSKATAVGTLQGRRPIADARGEPQSVRCGRAVPTPEKAVGRRRAMHRSESAASPALPPTNRSRVHMWGGRCEAWGVVSVLPGTFWGARHSGNPQEAGGRKDGPRSREGVGPPRTWPESPQRSLSAPLKVVEPDFGIRRCTSFEDGPREANCGRSLRDHPVGLGAQFFGPS